MKELRDYRIRRYMFALVGCLPGTGRELILFAIAMRRKLAPGLRRGDGIFVERETLAPARLAGRKQLEGRNSASVVLHPICDLKTRLFRRLCVANARNSGAIAVLCALIRRKIHRFYESHQE